MDVWSEIAAHLLRLRPTCPRAHGAALSCASRLHRAAVKAAADLLPKTPRCILPLRIKGLSFCRECPLGFETDAIHYFPKRFCQFRARCCNVDQIYSGRRTVLLTAPGVCMYCCAPAANGGSLLGMVHSRDCPGCNHAAPSICDHCRAALTLDGFPEGFGAI